MSDNLDPITESLNIIYQDIFDHGMINDNRWTIHSVHLMWLMQAVWNAKDGLLRQNLMGTILSHIAVMYGNEIRVPSYLVSPGIGTHKFKITESFLPAEDESGETK